MGNMANFIYQIDLFLFYLINHTISNNIFDKFFVFITDVKHWYLIYFIFWAILFFKGGRKGKIAAVFAILLIIVSDQVSSSLIKNWIGRIRPSTALADARVLVGTGSFSFPSSHAVNNFAMAVYFSRLYPGYKTLLYITASLVALSRPYVGVHYPSDIIGGALIGALIGWVFAYLGILIENRGNIVINNVFFEKLKEYLNTKIRVIK